MDRAMELSCDKLVWYGETIKTKNKVSGAYGRQQYFTKRFYPSGLRGHASAQVRLLSLLAFGELHISVDVSDVIVAWKKVDGISKMKSMNGGKVTAR